MGHLYAPIWMQTAQIHDLTNRNLFNLFTLKAQMLTIGCQILNRCFYGAESCRYRTRSECLRWILIFLGPWSVQQEDVRNSVYLGFNYATVSRHRFTTVTEQIELLIFYPPVPDAAQNKCHANCGNKWAEGEVISHLLSHNFCAKASQWRSDGSLMQIKSAAAVKKKVWMDDFMFHKVES